MNRRACALFSIALAACTPLKIDSANGADSGSPDATTSAEAGGLPDAAVALDSGDATVDPADASVDSGDAGLEASPGDAEVEASVDARPPCTPLSLTASEIYVDVNATGPSYGSQGCPLRSITEAVQAAARSSAVAKTIHLASGVYDDHLETFPIDLRNGISLVGDGAATTVIQGLGHALASSYWREYYATLDVGNADIATAIHGVKILPGPLVTNGKETMAVFCDAGNVTFPGTTPPPNTELSDLEIGPGFYSDVKIVGAPSACNLRLMRSKLHGGKAAAGAAIGVLVGGSGCGGYNSAPNQPYPIALELGDGTSTGGNTFEGFRGDAAWGVLVQGCTASFTATSNVIEDSDIGLWIETLSNATEPVPTIRIANNTFQRISGKTQNLANQAVLAGGVFIEAPRANVADFSGNTFSEVRAPAGSPPVAALSISAISSGMGFPASFHARGNRFVGNDIGVLMQSDNGNVLTSSSTLDFGVGGNGNNEFRCNAHTAASPGGDVVIDAANDGTAALSLSGNAWDHASPTASATSTPADGTDVAVLRTPKPTIDTSSPRTSALACPAGFTP